MLLVVILLLLVVSTPTYKVRRFDYREQPVHATLSLPPYSCTGLHLRFMHHMVLNFHTAVIALSFRLSALLLL